MVMVIRNPRDKTATLILISLGGCFLEFIISTNISEKTTISPQMPINMDTRTRRLGYS